MKLITSEIVVLWNPFFFFFFQNARKFYLDFKNAIKSNLAVEIFPSVVAEVINLYLGENVCPLQSTCQVKSLKLHFFSFTLKVFSTFASSGAAALSKRQIKFLLYE